MAIVLIVEDGTGLPNANTYIDVIFLQTYAENMNVDLPIDTEEVKSLILQAMPFIESQNYQGIKANGTQALKWPRKRVRADGYDIPFNVVPTDIKNAQAQAALLISQGVELMPTGSTSGAITEETVGPITTKYSDKYPAFAAYFGMLSGYLGPYLIIADGGYKLSPWFGF